MRRLRVWAWRWDGWTKLGGGWRIRGSEPGQRRRRSLFVVASDFDAFEKQIVQSGDVLIVVIECEEARTGVHGRGCDPHVVGGNRPAHSSECRVDFAVSTRDV